MKLLDPGKVLCGQHRCLVVTHTPACTETVLVINKIWRAVYKNSESIRSTFLTSSFHCGTSQGQIKLPEVKRETEMNIRSRILRALEVYMTSGQEKYGLFLSGSSNVRAA